MKTYASTFILNLSLFSLISFALVAQKSPIKYGKVVRSELEMKVYPADTSASAAILCDYGYFNSSRFEFVRTLRIKIFKKEGTSWGNQVFPVDAKTDIRGITYNLENGEIVESKLKSESIFMERVTEHIYRTRVAMPNVREGSIIDMEFSYTGLPSEWLFQQEVPVRWSELIIESSSSINFRKIFFGFEPLSESSDTRWVAKEMPAFKKEPFMSSAKNYISKYEIEILNINISPGTNFPTGLYREFSTTWEAVNTRLGDDNFFGKAMQGCYFLNAIAKDIKKKYASPYDRMIAAHELVKKSVKWNENQSVFATSENLSYVFNKKIGSSGDINLILIQLLKKLDFEVYPVALSTRENGFLSPIAPSLKKLNYVVAYVLLDEKKYFLDATEQYLPAGMLPQRCINIQGRLIDAAKSSWIDLETTRKDKKYVKFDMTLDSNNLLVGQITRVNYDYAGLDFRRKYDKFNSKEEYLKNFESENKGLSVIDCSITQLDSLNLPVVESYNVKIKNAVVSAGNLLFINPFLFDQLTSNPFRTEQRKYPVDFIYPSEKTYIFKITLPQGTEASDLPKPLIMKLPDGSATMLYQVTALGNSVQLTYKFMVTKAMYSEAEYADLRALFSELIKKQSEQIMIKTI